METVTLEIYIDLLHIRIENSWKNKRKKFASSAIPRHVQISSIPHDGQISNVGNNGSSTRGIYSTCISHRD